MIYRLNDNKRSLIKESLKIKKAARRMVMKKKANCGQIQQKNGFRPIKCKKGLQQNARRV
jgi:hypothetical protein